MRSAAVPSTRMCGLSTDFMSDSVADGFSSTATAAESESLYCAPVSTPVAVTITVLANDDGLSGPTMTSASMVKLAPTARVSGGIGGSSVTFGSSTVKSVRASVPTFVT